MKNIVLLEPDHPYGHEIIQQLDEDGVPAERIKLFTAQIAQARTLSYGDTDVRVRDIAQYVSEKSDILICLPDAKKIAKPVKEVLECGGTVLDVTGALRTDPDAPIFCNGFSDDAAEEIFRKYKKARLPSVPALHLIKTLRPLLEEVGGEVRAVVTFHMPVSHVSKKARDELFSQTRNIYMNIDLNPQEFSKQIAFNIIPEAGRFLESGMTSEEWGMQVDAKQSFGKKFKMTCNGIQVPVFAGQAIQVNIEMQKELLPQDARKLWIETADIDVIDLESDLEYVTPKEIQGDDRIYISRVKEDISVENGLSYWSVVDNLRLVAREVLSFVKM